MATRPNVTVSVVDNSFVTIAAEDNSAHVSGMYSPNGLLTIFGVTADRDAHYMTIENLSQWVGKLNGSTYGGTAGAGPTAAWKTEWYSAYNYLLYGGILKITDTTYTFYDEGVVLDSVFMADLTATQANFVTNTVAQRTDIVGVLGCTFSGYTGGSLVPSGLTAIFPSEVANASDSRLFTVGGEKVTLGLSNTTVGENFVTVPLTADMAGCLARTDRDSTVWNSPAGTSRGRILNVVRLQKVLTPSEQDNLYNAKINPVIGIAGSGTFLFGDITREGQSTSTLTRINVVRVINYIKKTLTRTAKDLLFELNNTTTRGLFKASAEGFLTTVQAGGGLYDYKVVCDESNNTGDIIDANQFVADIYIKPAKSINYVKITITNLNTSAPLN